MKKRYALLSVSDKTGLSEFASTLAAQGFTLLSTGGTAQHLRAAGLEVMDVSDITAFPEMMEGRVKTLHPMVHGGLLAKRDSDAHLEAMKTHAIPDIRVLVVNLYPFAATLAKTDDAASLIEQIDVGGPTMLRAAAKNHAHITVVCDPTDYARVGEALAAGEAPLALKLELAAKVFAHTASYDTLIAAWMAQQSPDYFPAALLDATCTQILSYGENPHQKAALYQRSAASGGIAHATQLHGKALSYNNLQDADAAWNMVAAHTRPTVAIIKHMNPCGVAQGTSAAEAFSKALAGDPVSAFGGVLACNVPVDAAMVQAIGSLFLEVLIAPVFEEEALATLREKKKNLRLLKIAPEHSRSPLATLRLRAISGGYLLQTADDEATDAPSWQSVTTQQATINSETQFAWQVCKHVASNAIVLVKNGATIGIGAGQMSRVDAVRIAIEKARAHGHDTRGAILASDAFFPFADNVALAAEAGIASIIQPGGSVRDAEVIDAANAAGIAMLFTGRRHFRH